MPQSTPFVMPAEFHILGIRHHGPGSAISVEEALPSLQPDLILVEYPADAQDGLDLLQSEGIQPPVASLIFHKKDNTKTAILPFASFSPEWVALQYAKREKIPIRAFDAPMRMQWKIKEMEQTGIQTEQLLQVLAQIAGFQDIEHWWDHYFERKGQPIAIFDQIKDLMQSVRQDQPISRLQSVREAFMRLEMRKAAKSHQQIAVVCGAFHAPALSLDVPIKEDKNRLPSYKRTSITSSIVPFSYRRLAKQSGYASGVEAPLYYESVFTHRDDAPTQWISFAASALRNNGFIRSTDEVMAAIQLAESLCLLRDLQAPGLAELKEAVISSLCKGQTAPLHTIYKEAIIGRTIGFVPPSIQKNPLVDDFLAKIRSFRLLSFWQAETNQTQIKELDLRKPTHLSCSQFLHQVRLLGLHWAQKQSMKGSKWGSFHERWSFDWDIEDEIALFQASVYGLSVPQAAKTRTQEQLEEHTLALSEYAFLLDTVLASHLHSLLPLLLQNMKQQAAIQEDIFTLIKVNKELWHTYRYGSVRQYPTEKIANVATHLHLKICADLPYSCPPFNEEESIAHFQILSQYNQAFRHIDNQRLQSAWTTGLTLLLQKENTDARINGFTVRVLHDEGAISDNYFWSALQQMLDHAFDPLMQAAWLEGLLHGSSSLLLYHDTLFDALNSWVKQIDTARFNMVLPILNRCFSSYTSQDRRAIMNRVYETRTTMAHPQKKDADALKWVDDILAPALSFLEEE